jgi:hypothetical protein
MVQRNIKQNGRKRKNPEITEENTGDIRIFFFLIIYLIFAGFFIKLFLEAIKIDIVFSKMIFLFVYALVGFGLPILIIELYIYLKTGKKIFLLKEI